MPSIQEQFNKAVKFEEKGQYPEALEIYRSIVSEKNDYRDAYINMGSLHAKLDNLPEAIICYERVVELKGEHLNYYYLGTLHYRNEDFKKSALVLQECLNVKEEFTPAIFVMGLCFFRMHNISAAEESLRKVLEVWPNDAIALRILASVYYDTGRYTEALQLIDRAIVQENENTTIRKMRANVLYNLDRLGESAAEIKHFKNSSDDFKCYDEFIKTIPDDILTDKLGTIDEKIDSIKEKVQTEGDKESLIALSLCHLLKGDTDIAIDYLFEAKKRFSG